MDKFLVMNMASMMKTEHNIGSWSLAIQAAKIKAKVEARLLISKLNKGTSTSIVSMRG